MKSILIIGYGNQTRSDDGVGWYVAEEIEKATQRDALQVDVLKLNQLTVDLAEEIKDRELVIFVDAHAVLCECKPSALNDDKDLLQSEEVKPNYKLGLTAHYLLPETLLAICEGLYNKAPKARIFSVKGLSFDFGEKLSNQTQNTADQAVEQIIKMVRTSHGLTIVYCRPHECRGFLDAIHYEKKIKIFQKCFMGFSRKQRFL